MIKITISVGYFYFNVLVLFSCVLFYCTDIRYPVDAPTKSIK